MINNVYSTSSDWLTAYSNPGATPYINPTQPMTGMLRYNNNQMQVYDGGHWQTVGGGTATVDLTARTKRILEWAEREMLEQEKFQQLAKKHQAMEDALNSVREAQEKLRIIAILVEEEKTNA